MVTATPYSSAEISPPVLPSDGYVSGGRSGPHQDNVVSQHEVARLFLIQAQKIRYATFMFHYTTFYVDVIANVCTQGLFA